ncbi:MAG: flagellar hook-basal body complex protein FliE [Armatimonadetes bacterium]|nr:flagellar hook-basal body complex protein FliE [Armatimonadota bacterium]MDW8027478.1 flagellar hook-basal body complex protein FliE [Armatimonadota bacterium]
MQIEPIRTLIAKGELERPRDAEKLVENFGEGLKRLLREVEQKDAEAVELKRRLLTGEPVELHEVLIAVEKANLAFQTLLSVRNKLLEAYQELSRMPI